MTINYLVVLYALIQAMNIRRTKMEHFRS